MTKDIIKKTYEFAKNYHSNDSSGHDFEHIERVYKNACLLLKEAPQADSFIVKMSALLHDVDDHKLNTDGQNTLRFLQSLDLEPKLIDNILKTIETISFSTSGSNPEFETIEMELLSDADKLDAIGAIGTCRAIIFGASKGRPLFDEAIFPKENLSKQEYKDLTRKENHTINHFFDKLLKLKKAMQTDMGKKEAQKRHAFMVTFLNQFFEEQNVTEWQNHLSNYIEI